MICDCRVILYVHSRLIWNIFAVGKGPIEQPQINNTQLQPFHYVGNVADHTSKRSRVIYFGLCVEMVIDLSSLCRPENTIDCIIGTVVTANRCNLAQPFTDFPPIYRTQSTATLRIYLPLSCLASFLIAFVTHAFLFHYHVRISASVSISSSQLGVFNGLLSLDTQFRSVRLRHLNSKPLSACKFTFRVSTSGKEHQTPWPTSAALFSSIWWHLLAASCSRPTPSSGKLNPSSL